VRLLAWDTATRSTVVALLEVAAPATARPSQADRVLELRDDPPAGARPRHTELVLAFAARALADANTGWEGIDRLAVGVGPGTFTGVRIGVAAARALAGARRIPLVGVSTLRSLASGAARVHESDAGVVAVIDARRGEAFAAAWRGSDAGLGAAPVLGPAALAPAELERSVRALGDGWLAVGEGAVLFRERLEAAGARVPADGDPAHLVCAAEHCRLALLEAPRRPEDVLPDYVRAPDARPSVAGRPLGAGALP